MKLLALFALVGATAAQPEITTNGDGNLVVSRVVETTLTDIEVKLAQAQTAAASAAFDGTLQATVAISAQMNQMQTTMTNQMAAMQAAVAAASETQAATATRLSENMNTQFDALSNAISAELDVALAETAAEVSTSLSTSAASLSTSLSAAAAESSTSVRATGTAMAALNTSLLTALATKAPQKRHIWMGGCSSNQHGCWQDVCMDRVTHDSARPKFFKRTNTRMRALVAGIFRIDSMQITTSCSWGHTSFMVNGARITHTHQENRFNWWIDQHQHISWKIPINQDFWYQVCSRCGHTTHHWSYHSRQQFEWEGDWE